MNVLFESLPFPAAIIELTAEYLVLKTQRHSPEALLRTGALVFWHDHIKCSSYTAQTAAYHGRLDQLMWMHARGVPIAAEALYEALNRHHTHIVRWLLKTIDTWSADTVASEGNLDTLCLLHQHKMKIDVHNCILSAAEAGQLQILRWFEDKGYVELQHLTVSVMNRAAAKGHLEVVRWLHNHRCVKCTTEAMDSAAANGHLNVVQWLHTYRKEGCTTYAMTAAAGRGHLHVVKWLHRYRNEGCTTEAMDNAASYGNIDVLNWLHQHRHEGCTTEAMNGAAAHGHLHILEWLKTNRHEGCTARAFRLAIEYGHAEIAKWLVAKYPHNCQFNEVHILSWTTNGTLELIKTVYENGWGTMSSWVLAHAAYFGELAGVEYLHHMQVECISSVSTYAAQRGHLHILQWLHGNACKCIDPNVSIMDVAANAGHLHILKWLHENKVGGCTTNAMDCAAMCGRLEILQWLHENRTEGCHHALRKAAGTYQLDTICWLLENRPRECKLELAQWDLNVSRGNCYCGNHKTRPSCSVYECYVWIQAYQEKRRRELHTQDRQHKRDLQVQKRVREQRAKQQRERDIARSRQKGAKQRQH